MQGTVVEPARAGLDHAERILSKMPDLTVNHRLRQLLVSNLEAFDSKEIVDHERKNAAVALVVTNCQQPADIDEVIFDPDACDQAAFILTTRSARLNNHRGQRAFPGGRIDHGETAEQAALRELEEEIGLKLSNEHILGQLDDYATRSGYVITPIVFWGGSNLQMRANPDEVETIHAVPIKELLREDAPMLESIPESEQPVLKMPLGSRWFAAPTAAIAYQFREVAILGKSTRVAHFEQPYFAWK
ncbi:MAG: CoA pyrophosphatase [Gammaproteobacteria bacterium]|nr:CoA pyrophosphatase [Gammaproteobacteria bacterium]